MCFRIVDVFLLLEAEVESESATTSLNWPMSANKEAHTSSIATFSAAAVASSSLRSCR